MTEEAKARAAYDAYRTTRRHFRPLPVWDLLLDRDKRPWFAVVTAVSKAA